jgi:hypothetical protein
MRHALPRDMTSRRTWDELDREVRVWAVGMIASCALVLVILAVWAIR